MKTDDLVSIVAQDMTTEKPPITLGSCAILLGAISCLITKLWLGLRPELEAMTITASFCFKTFVLISLAILSVKMLKASSVPMGRFTIKYFGVGLVAFFACCLGFEWMTKPAAQIGELFLLPNFKACLMYTTIYGSAITIIILAMIKRAAPLHYERTAGLIGLASAAVGSVGYSIHCPIDSPTFILVAYGLPQLTLYFIARLLFARFLHW